MARGWPSLFTETGTAEVAGAVARGWPSLFTDTAAAEEARAELWAAAKAASEETRIIEYCMLASACLTCNDCPDHNKASEAGRWRVQSDSGKQRVLCTDFDFKVGSYR